MCRKNEHMLANGRGWIHRNDNQMTNFFLSLFFNQNFYIFKMKKKWLLLFYMLVMQNCGSPNRNQNKIKNGPKERPCCTRRMCDSFEMNSFRCHCNHSRNSHTSKDKITWYNALVVIWMSWNVSNVDMFRISQNYHLWNSAKNWMKKRDTAMTNILNGQ